MSDQPSKLRTIRSFVRREGRMTPAQQRALEQYWPQYGLDVGNGLIDYKEVFSNNAPVILDIGFGMGESLIQLASENTQLNFIGVEVHRPGVGTALIKAHEKGLENTRIFCKDVNEVLKHCIPASSLLAILLFFPDPWHKKRHHKRRLIQASLIQLLADKLKPEGVLHIATDWENYAEHIQGIMEANESYRKIDQNPIIARPSTKYEQRGKKLGHQVWDLVYSMCT